MISKANKENKRLHWDALGEKNQALETLNLININSINF